MVKHARNYDLINVSNRIKHFNFSVMLKELTKIYNDLTFIELHSGAGIEELPNSKEYRCSSYRGLRILRDSGISFKAFLYEIDDDSRDNLENVVRNILALSSEKVKIDCDFRSDIEQISKKADSSYVFLVDPNNLSEYFNRINKGVILLDCLKTIVSQGAHILAYCPQDTSRQKKNNLKKMKRIRKVFRNGSSSFIDLKYYPEKASRLEHNLLHTDLNIIEKVAEKHRIKASYYKSKTRPNMPNISWTSY